MTCVECKNSKKSIINIHFEIKNIYTYDVLLTTITLKILVSAICAKLECEMFI